MSTSKPTEKEQAAARQMLLRENIAKGIVPNKDGSFNDDVTSYNANLPAKLTPELDELFDTYRKDFAAASTGAYGDAMVRQMAANPEIDTCSVSIVMGQGTKPNLEISAERSHTYPGLDGRDPVVKYGVVTVTHDTRFPGIRQQREQVAQLGQKLLGGEAKK